MYKVYMRLRMYMRACVCMYERTYVRTYVCTYGVYLLAVTVCPFKYFVKTVYGSVDCKCLNQQAFRSDCSSRWHFSEHTRHHSRPVFVSNCYCGRKDKHLYCTALCKFSGDSALTVLTTHTISMWETVQSLRNSSNCRVCCRLRHRARTKTKLASRAIKHTCYLTFYYPVYITGMTSAGMQPV